MDVLRARAARDSAEAMHVKATMGHKASVVSLVAEGMSFDEAIVVFAHGSNSDAQRVEARAFLQRLVDDPAHATIGCVGFGIFLSLDGLHESALAYFRKAGATLCRTLAPFEYYDSFVTEEKAKGLKDLARYLSANRDTLSSLDRMALLKVLAKHHAQKVLADEALRLAKDEAREPALSGDDAIQLRWYVEHLHRDEPKAESIPGAINVAVMDYKLLDKQRTSSNRGDYVQTLAAISHLLRFSDVEFVGDSALASYLSGLQDHVLPERRIEGVAAKVQPIALDRDFASGRSYPDNTWLICNGWFMHRSFRGPVDFPFPPSVNPLMLSFHIQEVDVLTDEVVERLREYEPIGCRDWTTVYRLRDVGVSCFFSGCVTTTVGQVLPKATPTRPKRLALVETALDVEKYAGWEVKKFVQIGPHVRDFSLVEGIEDARQMLAEYAPFGRVATSRLHCYLPARSMGLPVDFRPKNRSDVRFEGLLDLDDAAFSAIRSGLEDKLESLLRAILAGATRDEVHELWVELTREEVEFAEKYCTTYPPPPASSIDLADALDKLRASKTTRGDHAFGSDVVNTAYALDQNLEHIFPVVLQSVAENTTRDVNCHVMVRGLGEDFFDRLHADFPQFNFFFYDFGVVDYGDKVNLLKHISISTMDRLFLPELLDDLDKVLYLDIDILVQGDVGELHDVELGDNIFAAKRTRLRTWANLVKPITRASLRFPPQQAWELRRRLHHESALNARTFNAGILTINLAQMRAENFTASNLFLVEECAMNDQDVFNLYSRDRVVEIPPAWNSVPSQDYEPDPRIIHWAGPSKPWKPNYVLFKDRFEATRDRVGSFRS